MLLLRSFDAGLAILEPVDYLTLQSIRKSLFDLPDSMFLAGWDFTGDPCTFPGVFCSSDRIIALALDDPRTDSPGFASRLSPALGHLSALAELSLIPGRIAGPIPPSLSLCRSLRFLALSRNFLSGAVPPSHFASTSHVASLPPFSPVTSIFASTSHFPPETILLLCFSSFHRRRQCHRHITALLLSSPSPG